MKKLFAISLVFIGAFLSETTAVRLHAQGQMFLSNLGEPSSGFVAVGSDSLIAVPFLTGDNGRGYSINSIQLLMSASTGNPNNFFISIHNPQRMEGPGTLVGHLTGPSPTTAGIYSYTAANMQLAPVSIYWLQVASDTPVANGSFSLNLANSTNFNSLQGWALGTGYDRSTDGVNWSVINMPVQLAINASSIPEPSSLLLFFGGLLFGANLLRRRI